MFNISVLLVVQANLPDTSPFLSAQMALVSTFFQMFIVLGMYNFAQVLDLFLPEFHYCWASKLIQIYLLDKCDRNWVEVKTFPLFLHIDGTPIETGPTPTPVNCQWSNWGICSETCGVGSRTRTIQVQAQNGGTECEGITIQECNLQLCPTSPFQSKTTIYQ